MEQNLLDTEALIKRLSEYESGPFPKSDIQLAIESEGEITPKLLQEIQKVVNNPKNALADGWLVFNVSLFLLAKFRETEAFPAIAKLCHLPHETIDDLLGDSITEHLHKLLASTFDGDLKALRDIVKDEEIDEFVRSAALDAQLILYKKGLITRDDLLIYLRSLFHELKDDTSYIQESLPSADSHHG